MTVKMHGLRTDFSTTWLLAPYCAWLGYGEYILSKADSSYVSQWWLYLAEQVSQGRTKLMLATRLSVPSVAILSICSGNHSTSRIGSWINISKSCATHLERAVLIADRASRLLMLTGARNAAELVWCYFWIGFEQGLQVSGKSPGNLCSDPSNMDLPPDSPTSTLFKKKPLSPSLLGAKAFLPVSLVGKVAPSLH